MATRIAASGRSDVRAASGVGPLSARSSIASFRQLNDCLSVRMPDRG